MIRADQALAEVNNATIDSLAVQGKRLQDVINRIRKTLEEKGIEIPESESPIPEVQEPEHVALVSGDQVLVHEYHVPYSYKYVVKEHEMRNSDNTLAHYFMTVRAMDADLPLTSIHTLLKEMDQSGNYKLTIDEYYWKLKDAFEDNLVAVQPQFTFEVAGVVTHLFKDNMYAYSDFVQGVVKNPILVFKTYTRVTENHGMYEQAFENYPLNLEGDMTTNELLPSSVYWSNTYNANDIVIIK